MIENSKKSVGQLLDDAVNDTKLQLLRKILAQAGTYGKQAQTPVEQTSQSTDRLRTGFEGFAHHDCMSIRDYEGSEASRGGIVSFLGLKFSRKGRRVGSMAYVSTEMCLQEPR